MLKEIFQDEKHLSASALYVYKEGMQNAGNSDMYIPLLYVLYINIYILL